MSLALFDTEGLRFRRQTELRLREQIKNELVENIQQILFDMNQMWRFEEVETPLIMPKELMNASYDLDDIFVLQNKIANKDYALRAETTLGSYLMAVELLKTTSIRSPLCIYTHGPSFRVENSDGATAAKLRFNQFHQLEFQLIYGADTKAPIVDTMIEKLPTVVNKILNKSVRTIESDRLPSYSIETIDIEVEWYSETAKKMEFKEIASMSLRKDFPLIPGHKPYQVFEIAFGTDRLLAMKNNI
jgi:seryl-tRNA synthetase